MVGLELLFMYAFHGLFSFSVEKLQQISGGFGIADTAFFYRFDYLHKLFSHYGNAGKMMYLQLQTIDMIYPLVYSTLLASLLYLVIRKGRWAFFIFLPPMAALFDYAENISLRINLLMFPSMNHFLANASGIFTCLKWSLVYLSVLVLIAVWIGHMFFRKGNPKPLN